MKHFMSGLALLSFGLLLFADQPGQVTDDPYIWLENVEGERALQWVKNKNAESQAILTGNDLFDGVYSQMKDILNAKDRIAEPEIHGKYLYNFWRDEAQPRGVWRRTSLESYVSKSPEWELVLDVDKLAKVESENWVFKDSVIRSPDGDRALIHLSRGGADAVVVREFNLQTKTFVEDGFSLTEAKSTVAWRDLDHLYVATDFTEGSLTDSGYPRMVRLWKRGTAISEAVSLFEGEKGDVGSWAISNRDYGDDHDFVLQLKTFYTSDIYAVDGLKLSKLDLPDDATIATVMNGQLIVELKSDWLTFKRGSVVSADYQRFLDGERIFQLVLKPDERSSVSTISRTKDLLLVVTLENVKNRIHQFRFEQGKWVSNPVSWEQPGTIAFVDDVTDSNQYFVTYTGFLTPSSLWLIDGDKGSKTMIKTLPAFFDASPYEVRQYEATSKDGTLIPYFVVMRKDVVLDGSNPTLLYAYGGFEVSIVPKYSASVGKIWLDRGGVYALANIRGGGEFGPKWHQAALKKNRHKAFEDFIAVSENLIDRGVTSTPKLAIRGGSNGGLLVGTAFTMRPDLYRGVVCQVPLLDMKRFNQLLAGASWMGEFGNPDDVDMWSYIRTYSPYHNLHKDTHYPKVLFTTSTRDDRVHPGHARKMVARMTEMGIPVYYYENMEGGHAGAANNEQRAYSEALIYSYLSDRLMQDEKPTL